MGWIALCAALAGLIVVSLRVWRQWIEPWRRVDELVAAISDRKQPQKFLMTGNPRAQAIGLALEKVSARLAESEVGAHSGIVRLQTILAALPDALAVVDQRGRLQMTNARFSALFGLAEAPSIGVPLFEIVREVTLERSLGAALETGEIRSESITRVNGDATLRFDVSMVPFERKADRPGGAVVLFRDVTQLHQTEEMRRDFVANVSHELRTPLSIFRGYLETLLDDPQQAPDELVRILKIMERHSDRLTALVDDVLSLARLEAQEAQLDLTDVQLEDFLPLIMRDWEKRFAAKQVQGKLELRDDLPALLADEARLQEAIYNLLDNAVKYSAEGGRITVSATVERDALRISVADTGPGIPARDLPRIFERFYRADKARSRTLGGTGLGLSIVKHVAQLHRGRVEAESDPGRGTKISLILPLTAEPAVTQSSH